MTEIEREKQAAPASATLPDRHDHCPATQDQKGRGRVRDS